MICRSATTFNPSASTAILPTDQGSDQQPNIHDERHATGVTMGHSVPSYSKIYDFSIPERQLGVLRIVIGDGTSTRASAPQYIWRGRPPFQGNSSSDQLRTTVNRQEALVVCFIQSPEPHPIGCLVSVCAGRVACKPPHASCRTLRTTFQTFSSAICRMIPR